MPKTSILGLMIFFAGGIILIGLNLRVLGMAIIITGIIFVFFGISWRTRKNRKIKDKRRGINE